MPSDLRDILLYVAAQFAGMLVISLVAVAWEGSGIVMGTTALGLLLVGLIAIGLTRVRRWLHAE